MPSVQLDVLLSLQELYATFYMQFLEDQKHYNMGLSCEECSINYFLGQLSVLQTLIEVCQDKDEEPHEGENP